MARIVFQGIEGSYGEIAAVQFHGKDHHYTGLKTFRDVFEKVSRNEADFGIIPIENSLVGSIHENYDLLHATSCYIHGEIHIPIEHHLLAVSPDVSFFNLRRVMSHPKALEQCKQFFLKHPWIEAVTHFNTAEAALELSKLKDPCCAAIASLEAARLYGLYPISNNIQDNQTNYTRFISIRQKFTLNGNKCSLLLKLKHEPQALFRMLESLTSLNLNLTKLESRPIPGKPFEYLFYLDFEHTGIAEKQMQQILEKLNNKSEFVKNLGFYKAGWSWKI